LAGVEVVVDIGAAETDEIGVLFELLEHRVEPTGRNNGVAVDIGDQFGGRGAETAVAGGNEAFLGLIDDAGAGVGGGDFSRPVGRVVVDHHHVAVPAAAFDLGEHGFDAFADQGFLVVRGDYER
jgi:hypothetical protein